ncbi:hypothetical protein [Arthrobacter sp. A5]|uniref:hypothetical protein n=1 Tax=Arthrobacter sp. A5 TaxID=576926 RepID=UPI003DA92961
MICCGEHTFTVADGRFGTDIRPKPFGDGRPRIEGPSIRRPRRGKTASPALALGKQAQALVASADPPGDRLKRNEIFLIDAIDLKPSPGSVLDNADDRCTRRYRFPVYIQHTSTVSRAGKSIVKTGLKESVVVLVDGSPIEEDYEFKIAHVVHLPGDCVCW